MIKTCAVFIPILTSLKDWEDIGILSRELHIYHHHHIKMGTKFIIFSSGNERDKQYEKLYKGISVVPLNIPNIWMLILKFPFLPLIYIKEIRKVDIVKLDQMWSAWIGLWFSFFYRKKLWARMGYEHYQLQCSQGSHYIKRLLTYILSRLTYQRASYITVTTEKIKDFIVATFGIKSEKIFVKSNYIDTELFIRKTPPKISDRILFIGRIDKVKNLFNIVEACKLSGFSLDIIGKGPLKSDLETFSKENGVEINFLGMIPNQNLPKIIETYKYFILASFHEGNPKSLLEAMSMECVCIATDVPGINSIIKDKYNGFLSEVDGKSLGHTIGLATSSDTKNIQINARNYVIENNSLDNLVQFENELLYEND